MLDGGSFTAGGLNEGGLKGAEGDFINEPFSTAWAAWFPSHEGAIGNHAADGHGGIVEHVGGMLNGDTAGRRQGLARLGFHGFYFSRLAGKRNRKNAWGQNKIKGA